MASGERDEQPEREPLAPRSVEEAVARALEHGRLALAETAAAARCLLDAAALATTGAPSEAHAGLRRAAEWLARGESLARDATGRRAQRWMREVAAALDAEIARWEASSRDDPEARAVLRAFLGVREILWEIGLRPRAARSPARGPAAADATQREPSGGSGRLRRAGSARLERVPIERR
jgi:hypothetical protein